MKKNPHGKILKGKPKVYLSLAREVLYSLVHCETTNCKY